MLAAGAIDYGCENFRNLSKRIVNVLKLFILAFMNSKILLLKKRSSISSRFAATVGVARHALVATTELL